MFVLGHPAYYARFGYSLAAADAFGSDYSGPHFMALRLNESAPITGQVRYPAAFATWLSMPRYKLTIEYDGTPFVGWQIQGVGTTVQGVLTAALAALCGHVVKVAGAGRTDAGVHALGQVAHVDLAKDWRPDRVRDAVNAHLRPHPVAVLAGGEGAGWIRCALLGEKAPLSLSHRQPPCRSRARPAARLARAAPARRRGDARRRATTGRPARFHHVPLDRVPGEVAGQDARRSST